MAAAPPSLAISGPFSDTSDFHFPDGPPLVPRRVQPPFHALENIPGRFALNIQHGLRGETINEVVPSIAREGEVLPLFTSVRLLSPFDLRRCFSERLGLDAGTICKDYRRYRGLRKAGVRGIGGARLGSS